MPATLDKAANPNTASGPVSEPIRALIVEMFKREDTGELNGIGFERRVRDLVESLTDMRPDLPVYVQGMTSPFEAAVKVYAALREVARRVEGDYDPNTISLYGPESDPYGSQWRVRWDKGNSPVADWGLQIVKGLPAFTSRVEGMYEEKPLIQLPRHGNLLCEPFRSDDIGFGTF